MVLIYRKYVYQRCNTRMQNICIRIIVSIDLLLGCRYVPKFINTLTPQGMPWLRQKGRYFIPMSSEVYRHKMKSQDNDIRYFQGETITRAETNKQKRRYEDLRWGKKGG